MRESNLLQVLSPNFYQFTVQVGNNEGWSSKTHNLGTRKNTESYFEGVFFPPFSMSHFTLILSSDPGFCGRPLLHTLEGYALPEKHIAPRGTRDCIHVDWRFTIGNTEAIYLTVRIWQKTITFRVFLQVVLLTFYISAPSYFFISYLTADSYLQFHYCKWIHITIKP